MKVTIAVNGHFHAMQLASQLQRHHALAQLMTTYPKRFSRAYHIEDQHVVSFFSQEILKRGLTKGISLLNKIGLPSPNLETSLSRRFDKLVQSHMKQADIFVGWSGSVGGAIKQAQQSGSLAILERGSTHILHQEAILREELALNGVEMKHVAHPRVIENELHEYEQTDYIAIPSTFVKKTFIEKGVPPEKLFVNHYGSNFQLDATPTKKAEEFTVIFCGSGGYRKGLPYLLRAFDELKLPKAKLVVIGHIESGFTDFIKRYQSDRIIFTGSLHRDQLITQFARAHAFCLPSIEEGLALVLLQAMACGLPVICTPNTGAEDVIEEGKQGFLIPIRSVDAIKEKILQLYENREQCDAMAQAARRSVCEDFTWDAYGERAFQFYQSILKS